MGSFVVAKLWLKCCYSDASNRRQWLRIAWQRPFDDGWTFLLGWGCLNGQMNDYMVKWPIDWLDFECHTNKNNTKQTNKQTANKQKTNKQQTANIKHWTTEITISEAFRDHKYAKKIINMVAHARFTHILMAFSQL